MHNAFLDARYGTIKAERLKYLIAASTNVEFPPLINFVYEVTLPAEIDYLVEKDLLPVYVGYKLKKGFKAAASIMSHLAPGAWNSAGLIPRTALIEADVTLPEFQSFLTILAHATVAEPAANGEFTLYGTNYMNMSMRSVYRRERAREREREREREIMYEMKIPTF